jgi:hypothetical protein
LGDDRVETGVEGLVFDRRRVGRVVKGVKAKSRVLEAHAPGPIEEVEKRRSP